MPTLTEYHKPADLPQALALLDRQTPDTVPVATARLCPFLPENIFSTIARSLLASLNPFAVAGAFDFGLHGNTAQPLLA